MSVKGKRIVVTGGARGIGARLVGELRERGAEVTSTDILPDCDIVCDVSDEQDVIALFDQIGDIDGLVNNAALLVGRRPFQEISVDEWDRMMAVNVRGTFLCAREASKHMPNGGSIVNVSSTTALNGSQGFLHYVASKGAVISMTKTLAFELGPQQIRVNCVGPGFTPTEGSAVLGTYDPTATPLGRVMEPDDLLGTYCYLLGDDSKFVSAQTILVNGGRFPH
ncbi:MAG TPA: SDR family oxidoreductase [Ilumatobacteraceae bacterium]|jgi:NAD(P)-dependent dehydrogenase (short-subunit alcohol dehydrogenase family)|nr:SDR family oxidoreductase [Ilumatobacteraceae bacterium]